MRLCECEYMCGVLKRDLLLWKEDEKNSLNWLLRCDVIHKRNVWNFDEIEWQHSGDIWSGDGMALRTSTRLIGRVSISRRYQLRGNYLCWKTTSIKIFLVRRNLNGIQKFIRMLVLNWSACARFLCVFYGCIFVAVVFDLILFWDADFGLRSVR